MPKSAKNGQNLPLSDEKNPNFEFSHRYHYSYTLEDTQEKILGSFQPKLMTKFKVISQKPSKNWIFGQNGHFLTVFGQKWPIFEFFSKIRLEHFFTFPKPYLTAKFQKKLMNGCLDICVTHVHLLNFIQSIFQTKYVSTANTHTSLPTHQLAAEQ